MKNSKKSAVFIVITLALGALTACSVASENAQSNITNVTTTQSTDTEEITKPQSSALSVETEKPESQTTENGYTTTEIIEITSFAEQTEPPAEKLIYQNKNAKIVNISEGNVFIDFEYKSDVKLIEDESKLEKQSLAAKKAILESDEYKNSEVLYEYFSDDEIAPYQDENGKIIPIFSRAIVDDFDRDGKTESFIFMKMPKNTVFRDYLVFVNNDGNAELLDNFYSIFEISVLDYGIQKQLIVGSHGEYGTDSHTVLFAVKADKAELLYRLRGHLEKQDCFLSASGWQGYVDFMYFDTVEMEYRGIMGKFLPIDKAVEMDTTNVLTDYFGDKPEMYVMGGKYYCLFGGVMDLGNYFTYENNRFVPLDTDSGIRVSSGFLNDYNVIDFDYDKAVSTMVSPQSLE